MLIDRSREEVWERTKLILVLGVIVLFLISTYTSYGELQYLVWGRTTSGVVTKHTISTIQPSYRRRSYGPAKQLLLVSYQFTDNAQPREESQSLSIDYQIVYPPGTPVTIQYLPGSPNDSRIDGQTNIWLTIPFTICFLLIIGFIIWFIRDFNKHQKRMAESRARYG